MGGVRLGGRITTVTPAIVFGVANSDGVFAWDDIWLVPQAGGTATQLTNAAQGVYYDVPVESANRTHIAYLFTTDAGPDSQYLRVINTGGTGDLSLVAASVSVPLWIDNDWILYRNGTGTTVTALRKIKRDGTGDTTVVSKANIAQGHPSPDGTKIAYTVSASPSSLWIIDADGTNDTQLLSDIGTNIASPPSWRRDGSAIMYANGNGTYRMETIAPDGTGQTTVASPMPNGFWDPAGMHTDRFFYTDTTTGTNWKLGQIVFGSGASLVSPALSLSRSTHRGVAIVDYGRVFSVQNGDFMAGGVDSFVSVLPDGSDLVRHFDPNETGTPVFQNVGFR